MKTLVWLLVFQYTGDSNTYPVHYMHDFAHCVQLSGQMNAAYIGQRTYHCEQRAF